MPDADASIAILIADDHTLFRAGLRRLLETEPDFRVVGEASDGTEATRLARTLAPDVVLLDLSMPGGGGLGVLRELGSSSERMRTLVLAATIETDEIVQALQLGARGVILKDAAADLLFKGIRAIMKGEYWVGRGSVSDLVEALRGVMPRPETELPKTTFGLTDRELEIVAAVLDGLPNRDIAKKLSISEQTVKHHLTSVFDKVGVSNRLELAVFAMHYGLVTPPRKD